jgi:hypothetical protein
MTGYRRPRCRLPYCERVCYSGRWIQLGPRHGPGARGPVTALRPATPRAAFVARVGRWTESVSDRLSRRSGRPGG